jgi:hypothetical protein
MKKAKPNKATTYYKRNKVEINGEHDNVKWLMWLDFVLNSKVIWIILIAVILLIMGVNINSIPILVKLLFILVPVNLSG